MSRRLPLHRLAARILAGVTLVTAAACSLVAGLNTLQFTACSETCTPPPGACVVGGCMIDGGCQPQLQPVGADCSAAGGFDGECTATGACVIPCQTTATCPNTNPCTTVTCDPTTNTCLYSNQADGTPITGGPTSYCQAQQCMGGVVTTVDDDDAGPPPVACNTTTCMNGALSIVIQDAGTACGPDGGQLCNDAGLCGCTKDTDCTSPQTCGGGDAGAHFCGCTLATCDGLGQTCGTPPNGCNTGTIDCNGDAATPNETDVNCGGDAAACPNRCDAGQKCLTGTDCATTFCADDVCCDVQCEGVCEACDQAGSVGVCVHVKLNQTTPRCNGQLACAANGTCKRAPGTSCNLNSNPPCTTYCDTSGHCA